MLGAIAGDIIGSVYEWNPIKTKDFPLFRPDCRFTDDTVLTVAVAKAIIEGIDYKETMLELARKYPDAGYGSLFFKWFNSPDPKPYYSFGNGSAMRVSPVGFAFDSAQKVLEEAKRSAEVTHNHPEGIKGAQAVALSVFLARKNHDKSLIKREITRLFGYNLNRTVDEIRASYTFYVTCQKSVPEAIISFLGSKSWEDSVRNAISLGGDSDTLACIAGGIAEAYYGPLPDWIVKKVIGYLPEDLWEITKQFCSRYGGYKFE